MSFNVFGRNFRITTFGESHGPAIGVVIDGVPPLVPLDVDFIQSHLDRRKPGQSSVTTQRQEQDRVEVISGVFEGRTTGAPLCLIIANKDMSSEEYEILHDVFRPGHADFSYMVKYGIRDWRGGGRASGRETAARVAAGAVARQLLLPLGVNIVGHVIEAGGIRAKVFDPNVIENNPVRCADPKAAQAMIDAIQKAQNEGDSVGGIVEVIVKEVPSGWGDPVFGKLDALLAFGLMGIGAVKGVEIGDGFKVAGRKGSENNDAITPKGFASNHAGGIVGGISTGADIVVRIAVKPTPSIAKPQETIDINGNPKTISVTGRHDPCIAPRLVPVAEAMVALVLVDTWLSQRAIDAFSQ